eukprot:gb/GEZN01001712.1/.p1 GENE.gb/GEZN01001712.1/~~gb/GEZN01001712.1/.p1  ORF type:complete len:803 (+),score=111.84 gb/GEZN01001712.1/:42-2411(+)
MSSVPYAPLQDGRTSSKSQLLPGGRGGWVGLLLTGLAGLSSLRFFRPVSSVSPIPAFTPQQGIESVTLTPAMATMALPITLNGVTAIFTYGPLRDDSEGAAFAAGLRAEDAKIYGATLAGGSAQSSLLHLGRQPGSWPFPILTGRSADAISGRLLVAPVLASLRGVDFKQKLAAADRLHGWDERHPEQGLWRRTVVPAVTRQGRIIQAIWYYQASSSSSPSSPSGNPPISGKPISMPSESIPKPSKPSKAVAIPNWKANNLEGLKELGIRPGPGVNVVRNPSYADLAVLEIRNKEGRFMASGAFTVDTGKFTGRSPKDKYIVKQPPSQDSIWWGEVNQPMTPQVFQDLYQKVIDHYNSEVKEIYVFDGYTGSNPRTRKKVRFITELAWQNHFARNMFIRPDSLDEIAGFLPDFTIINACKLADSQWKQHGLNSEVFIAFNIEKKVAIIGGTWYAGEMKKGIFSMMQYWLPLQSVLTMHCSANKGKAGDTALFFGLSGTGKTTLSADPKRMLIGDDEHGWDDDGVFNLEGGCYAKTVNLSEEKEPEIFHAIKRDALLENVWVNEETNDPDYSNTDKTENSRVSYPIYHIQNYERSGMGTHPSNVIFLSCDAYGVLPPVSKLSPGQAMYYFLSGYTAKVAGTERGVTEPSATFSANFGAAFLPLHPTKYAELLRHKLEQHHTKVYLVNTGWTGGSYGVGQRMSIKNTRACIDGILDGSIEQSTFVTDPFFGLAVPTSLGSIPQDVLDPRASWKDKHEYDRVAQKLAGEFRDNFRKYTGPGVNDYSQFGPKA